MAISDDVEILKSKVGWCRRANAKLEKKIAERNGTLESLRQELQRLKEEKKQDEENLKSAHTENTSLSKEKESIEKNLLEANCYTNRLNLEIKSLNDQVEQLQDELRIAKQSLIQAKNELETSQSGKQQDKEVLEAKLLEVTRQAKERDAQLKEVNRKLETEKESLRICRLTYTKLKKTLNALNDQRYDERIERLDKQIETLTTEKKGLEASLKKMVQEADESERLLDKHKGIEDKLSAEVERLKQIESQSSTKTTNLEQEVSRVRARMREEEDIQVAERVKSAEEKKQLQDTIDILEQELEDKNEGLRFKMLELEEMSENRKVLEGQIKEMENQKNNDYQKRSEELERLNQAVSRSTTENAELESRISKLKQEIRGQKELMQIKAKDFLEEREKLEQELSTVKNQLQSKEEYLNGIQQKLDNMSKKEEEIKAIEDQNILDSESIIHLTEETLALNEEIATLILSAEREVLAEADNDESVEKAQLRKIIRNHSEEANDVKERLLKLGQQVKISIEERNKITDNIKDLTRQREVIQLELDILQTKSDDANEASTLYGGLEQDMESKDNFDSEASDLKDLINRIKSSKIFADAEGKSYADVLSNLKDYLQKLDGMATKCSVALEKCQRQYLRSFSEFLATTFKFQRKWLHLKKGFEKAEKVKDKSIESYLTKINDLQNQIKEKETTIAEKEEAARERERRIRYLKEEKADMLEHFSRELDLSARLTKLSLYAQSLTTQLKTSEKTLRKCTIEYNMNLMRRDIEISNIRKHYEYHRNRDETLTQQNEELQNCNTKLSFNLQFYEGNPVILKCRVLTFPWQELQGEVPDKAEKQLKDELQKKIQEQNAFFDVAQVESVLRDGLNNQTVVPCHILVSDFRSLMAGMTPSDTIIQLLLQWSVHKRLLPKVHVFSSDYATKIVQGEEKRHFEVERLFEKTHTFLPVKHNESFYLVTIVNLSPILERTKRRLILIFNFCGEEALPPKDLWNYNIRMWLSTNFPKDVNRDVIHNLKTISISALVAKNSPACDSVLHLCWTVNSISDMDDRVFTDGGLNGKTSTEESFQALSSNVENLREEVIDLLGLLCNLKTQLPWNED